jgi:lysophospholipase L1-like esterase
MITINSQLDMTPGAIPVVIHRSQYDSDFSIVFTLFARTGNFTIASGTTAKVRGTKKSGTGYSADATIDVSAKTVTVTGDQQMTVASGQNVFEIVLLSGTKELCSANFILDVERAALDMDTITDDTVARELDNLDQFVTEAEAAADRAEAAAESVDFGIDPTLTQSGQAADAKVAGETITELKNDLGVFRFSQSKKARFIDLDISVTEGDVLYFKPLTWTGDAYTSVSLVGVKNGSYSTIVNVPQVGDEVYTTATSDYDSLRVSVNTASSPTEIQTLETILVNLGNQSNLSGILFGEVNKLQTGLNTKQNILTFDASPLANSTNPVTSKGIYNAVANIRNDLGVLKHSQTEKLRAMTVSVPCKTGDLFWFRGLDWTGDTWTQITIQGLYNGAYTVLLRATALNTDYYFTADKAYESFRVSINVSAVPTTETTFELILCNISGFDNLAGIVGNDRKAEFQFRGYLSVNANVNTVTDSGWWILAKERITGTTGLPGDITGNAILTVYPGNLTLQTLRELNYPFRQYQRYLYSNNTNQSVWIKSIYNSRERKAYLFGDSITKGTLGDGGTGISYLEIASMLAGYTVVNCGVGGIGYVYSAKKLTSEVPWNTGEGRIRAQDVINHYASELVQADTVIIAYGINDWQTLGDPNTTIAEADRRATSANITANVKTAIETVIQNNASARIIVITPINSSYRGGSISTGWGLQTALDNNGDGKEAMTLENIYQAIVDACNYYGVSYIDMTHNNPVVNYINISSVLPDKLHPSQNTYNKLAESIRLE